MNIMYEFWRQFWSKNTLISFELISAGSTLTARCVVYIFILHVSNFFTKYKRKNKKCNSTFSNDKDDHLTFRWIIPLKTQCYNHKKIIIYPKFQVNTYQTELLHHQSSKKYKPNPKRTVSLNHPLNRNKLLSMIINRYWPVLMNWSV